LAWRVLVSVALRCPERLDHGSRTALAVGCVLLLATMLAQQTRNREQLPVSPVQAEVRNYLDEHGEASAMLLLPYWDIGWLGKTRHATFADYQTAHLMTYMPKLGPSLKKMHDEVFGLTLDTDTG